LVRGHARPSLEGTAPADGINARLDIIGERESVAKNFSRRPARLVGGALSGEIAARIR